MTTGCHDNMHWHMLTCNTTTRHHEHRTLKPLPPPSLCVCSIYLSWDPLVGLGNHQGWARRVFHFQHQKPPHRDWDLHMVSPQSPSPTGPHQNWEGGAREKYISMHVHTHTYTMHAHMDRAWDQSFFIPREVVTEVYIVFGTPKFYYSVVLSYMHTYSIVTVSFISVTIFSLNNKHW